MANNQYMAGRKKYRRPQAILFSNNPGIIESGSRIPIGYEAGSNTESVLYESLIDQFIVLSDDNRQPIDFKMIRIEKRERMINGRMRSYHIADKRSFSVSWQMLPSRAFSTAPQFDIVSGKTSYNISGSPRTEDSKYTTDGGAGGAEILDWYNTHKGSFWVFLSYDNYKELGLSQPSPLNNSLIKYNEVIEMFITDFSYSVEKRGGTNHDLWSISMTLEEV